MIRCKRHQTRIRKKQTKVKSSIHPRGRHTVRISNSFSPSHTYIIPSNVRTGVVCRCKRLQRASLAFERVTYASARHMLRQDVYGTRQSPSNSRQFYIIPTFPDARRRRSNARARAPRRVTNDMWRLTSSPFLPP